MVEDDTGCCRTQTASGPIAAIARLCRQDANGLGGETIAARCAMMASWLRSDGRLTGPSLRLYLIVPINKSQLAAELSSN